MTCRPCLASLWSSLLSSHCHDNLDETWYDDLACWAPPTQRLPGISHQVSSGGRSPQVNAWVDLRGFWTLCTSSGPKLVQRCAASGQGRQRPAYACKPATAPCLSLFLTCHLSKMLPTMCIDHEQACKIRTAAGSCEEQSETSSSSLGRQANEPHE